MRISSFYPVLASVDVEASATFWIDHFGFETTFTSDWYVSLRHTGPPVAEIAFVAADHPTIPEGYRRPAAGLLVNVEVEDVDAQWQRLVVDGGLEPLLAIRSETFGQRHFIVAAPGGVMVDVITEIEPGEEYADGFTS